MQNRVRRTGWEVLMVKAHTRWKDGVWSDSSSWLCSGNASSTPDVPAKVSLLRYHLHFSLHDLRLIKHLPYSGSSQVSNSFCFRLFCLLFSCALPWSSVSLYLHLESIQASLWNPACMMSSSPLSGTRYQPHIRVCALMPIPLSLMKVYSPQQWCTWRWTHEQVTGSTDGQYGAQWKMHRWAEIDVSFELFYMSN